MPANENYYIKDIAHELWIQDGKPNGEEYRDSEFGRMKTKDIHWRRAEIKAEVYLHHGPGCDW